MQKQTSLPANYRITKLSHNRKIELEFTDEYPLIKPALQDGEIADKTFGSYTVTGTVTLYPNESKLSVERYDASLDTITHNGTDIKFIAEFNEQTVDIEEYFICKYAGILENENGTVVHLVESLNNEAI